MDWPDLTDREIALLKLAKPVARVWLAGAAEGDRQALPVSASLDALRSSRLTALTAPVEQGGLGATLAETAVVLECLGRADASMALILGMNAQLIGSGRLSGSRPPAFEGRLHALVVGGGLVNSAASEPGMGSPARGGRPAAIAEPTAGGWAVTGRKSWVTGAPCLDAVLVSAGVDGATWNFLIELPAVGLSVASDGPENMALRATASRDLVLDRVFVPRELAVLPRPSMAGGVGWFWTVVAAIYLGVGWAALDALADYAGRRVPTALGRPISTLPKVRQAVGRMALTLSAARALLRQATLGAEPPQNDLTLLGAAKTACVEAAITATDLAMRAAGAAALTDRLPLERLFRDARAGLSNPPAEDVALERLAARVLGEA